VVFGFSEGQGHFSPSFCGSAAKETTAARAKALAEVVMSLRNLEFIGETFNLEDS
jgi:hypothetical protein